MKDKRELTQDLQALVHIQTATKQAIAAKEPEVAHSCMKAADAVIDGMVLRNTKQRKDDTRIS